jgi:coproporphyrinogen III oxidase-like Fe-S oxidoreductase
MKALINEIKRKNISGKPAWLYIGGGTPNTLNVKEIDNIISAIRDKVNIRNIGMELHPSLITKEYLSGLNSIGINKISIGIESFNGEILLNSGRKTSPFEHMKTIVDYAQSIGLWVTIDMMIGFNGQSEELFLKDIQGAMEILPNQMTIYPLMVINKGMIQNNDMKEERQFQLIEKAYEMYMRELGYRRKTIWTFGRDDDIYDSSRDELVQDYVGFGPAAFSTYGKWKVVNPELDVYLECYKRGVYKALIAEKTKATDDWRRFASMIYECNCHNSNEYPSYINFYIWLLKIFGYSKNGILTNKGRMFSHHITKTVVESLPFPLQNKHIIENLDEYSSYSGKDYVSIS